MSIKKPKAETFLVGVTYKSDSKEPSVLIVAKPRPSGVPDIINAFEGPEADELFKKLTIPVTKENNQ